MKYENKIEKIIKIFENEVDKYDKNIKKSLLREISNLCIESGMDDQMRLLNVMIGRALFLEGVVHGIKSVEDQLNETLDEKEKDVDALLLKESN